MTRKISILTLSMSKTVLLMMKMKMKLMMTKLMRVVTTRVMQPLALTTLGKGTNMRSTKEQ